MARPTALAETLTKRASGDLNTGGVVGFGVTRGDAVELLRKSAESDHYGSKVNIHGNPSGRPW